MTRVLFLLLACLFPFSATQAGEITVLAESSGDTKITQPFACAWDKEGGMLFVEMVGGEKLRRLSQDGKIETLAGTGKKGLQLGEVPGSEAEFNGMHALLVSKSGDVYLADTFNFVIRKYDPKTKMVSLFAGNGKSGFAGDGTSDLTKAQFSQMINIAFDADEKTMYIVDIGNRRVRAIDMATKKLSTVAGTGSKGSPQDGEAALTQPLTDPRAVCVDSKGTLYILERGGHKLYAVKDGKIRTVAGTGKAGQGGDGGPALKAPMNGPKFIACDRDDTVLIVDTENHQLRRYTPGKETMTLIAGSGKAGNAGIGGDAKLAQMKRPHGVLVDPKTGAYIIADSDTGRILKVSPQ
ncbi:MAG: hypothetical protein ACRC8S_19310 [Fimbriiglobus sp.]